jgi:arylsulfatase A-like enzyme
VRKRKQRPNRIVEIEAPRPLFEQNVPVNAWDRPYKGVRTDRYTYVVFTESGGVELYDRRKDPSQLRSVADDPAYAKIKARLAAKLAKLDSCRGRACHIKP